MILELTPEDGEPAERNPTVLVFDTALSRTQCEDVERELTILHLAYPDGIPATVLTELKTKLLEFWELP